MEINAIKITDINSEGFGVGRSESFSKVLFIKNAIIGEVVDVKITKEEKSFAYGEVLNFTTKSEFRKEAKCQHFGLCGGCSLQHVKEDLQIQIKTKQISDALKKFAKIENFEMEKIITGEKNFNYRNKMDFAFSALPWITNERENKERKVLGLHTFGRFDRVLHIENCHLIIPEINKIRNFIYSFALEKKASFWNQKEEKGILRDVIFRTNKKNEICVIIIFGEQPKVFQADLCMVLKNNFPEVKSLYWGVNKKAGEPYEKIKLFGFIGEEFYNERILDLNFQISLKSFSQVNMEVFEKMILKLIEIGNFKTDEVVYDFYCGVGSFSLPVAKLVKKVIGVEISSSSIADARINAKENEIKNVKFLKEDVTKALNENFLMEHGKAEKIILDPPRAGLSKELIEKLNEFEFENIFYVSCNPASFARDVGLLSKYKLEKVIPFEMFPQTNHVELIAKFSKI